MRILALVTMICVSINTTSYAAETAAEVKTFPAKGISSVDIRTNSALIYMENVETADIRVEQLPDNARACNVTMKVVGKQLVLKALNKAGEYKDIKTGLRVFLPKGISITAKSNSGDIELHRLTASIEARTDSGDIELDEVSGNLKATSTSGDVKGTIQALETSKPIALKSVSGDISVVFPETAAIVADATTTSGKVHNEFAGKTGGPITARTVSGDISLVKAGK